MPSPTTDPFESSGQHAIPAMDDSSTPYSRTPSREISEAELADMRKMAKIASTLSGVVERQNQVERFVRQASERLAKGEVLLETLARRAEEAMKGVERVRDEITEIQAHASGNTATAAAQVQAAAAAAQATKDLLAQHQTQCDKRWEVIKTQMEQQRAQAQETKGMNPLVATIIGTILSTLATSAVMGGLWAASQKEKEGGKPSASSP